jgi:hypothetical protein
VSDNSLGIILVIVYLIACFGFASLLVIKEKAEEAVSFLGGAAFVALIFSLLV